MHKRDIKVSVGGKSYTLTTDESEHVLAKAVEKVNQAVESCDLHLAKVNRTDHMILLSLRYCLELERVSEKLSKLSKKLEELAPRSQNL